MAEHPAAGLALGWELAGIPFLPDFSEGAAATSPQPATDFYTDPQYLQAVLAALHLTDGSAVEAPLDVTRAQVLAGEQTNTSILVDNRVLLKVYRQVLPGINPEILVGQALTALGSQITPRLLAAGYMLAGEEVFVTHVATEFVPGATDAFKFFTGQMPDLREASTMEANAPDLLAADLLEVDLQEAAAQLGAVTATMHTQLAQCFDSSQTLSANQLAQRVRSEFAATCQAVPALAQQPWLTQFQQALESRLGALEQENPQLPTQKIHGDYHLGQVLYAPAKSQPWQVIDFEGEPLRPLAERMLPDVALRDVAGMLRSFAYAAAMHTQKIPANWEENARKSYLRGYAPQGFSRLQQLVLEVLEIEKTCYECRYEATFRPDWLPVPLSGLQRFANLPANLLPTGAKID